MKKHLFIVLIVFQSCEFFQTKQANEKEIIKKEMKKIDFKTIDEFPCFITCDTATDKKNCFYKTLSQHIYENLDKKTVQQLLPKTDSLSLKITITHKAKINFEAILPDNLKLIQPKVDAVLNEKLLFTAEIKPAVKNKIPVTTYFTMPVKIN